MNFKSLKNKFQQGGRSDGDEIDPSAPVDPRQDNLGPYPTKVNVPALEARRFIWTTRAFAIAFYVSMFLNLVLASVIYTLVPLKRVEPMLLTFSDKSDQIVRIEPFSRGTTGFEIMQEKMLRDYVEFREEIEPSNEEMALRWGKAMRYMSTDNVYRDFTRQKQPLLEQARQRDIIREIKIYNVQDLNRRTVLVDFVAVDYDAARQPISEKRWRATVQYGFFADEVVLEDRFINPIGFKVTRYALAPIEN